MASTVQEPALPDAPPEPKGSKVAHEESSGVWYPKWYWPSFASPATIWLAIFFILPLYVVLSVAFGTSDPIFGAPLPVYEPWYWSSSSFVHVIGQIGRAHV